VKLSLALLSDPHRALHLLRLVSGMVIAPWALRQGEVGPRVSVMGPVELDNRGRARIGHHAYFLPGVLRTRLVVHPGGELEIGPYTGFGPGALVEANGHVTIGERCMFASMVILKDATIGNDVWIAHGATVEPGVTIGDGSVVAAGTTVTRDVPAQHLAIGTPVRNVKLDTLSRGR
jgi:carbonic anhydrase/acetyltransferase-like protein (isoleucine patch superfamily)